MIVSFLVEDSTNPFDTLFHILKRPARRCRIPRDPKGCIPDKQQEQADYNEPRSQKGKESAFFSCKKKDKNENNNDERN
ncbi:hypothetical protein JCM17845_15500 [Iodidimonas gelatinilytica]|uniref:Uncharacterized protein n=1 Tax=Iodidimonas gelatinilytica TaxID=1236966 RepID=A0A5A7MYH0_9PROT|nr:hypothetical protein JCM17845_15500 [Iodidimonas gelatinilytica]